MIAANGVRFRRNAEFKESVLAAISKTMTGVYIMHYSVFHLLTALIPVTSLSTKLALIVLTFVTSVLFSLLILSNTVAKSDHPLKAGRSRKQHVAVVVGPVNIRELDGDTLISGREKREDKRQRDIVGKVVARGDPAAAPSPRRKSLRYPETTPSPSRSPSRAATRCGNL